MVQKRAKTHGQTRSRRHTSAPRAKRQFKLNAATRRKIHAEATALGLSTGQYMRLVLSLSSTLRQGIAKENKVDGRQVLEWVDNPVFLAMIQWICQYAVTMMSKSETDDETTSQHTPQAPLSPSQHPQAANPPVGAFQVPQPQSQAVQAPQTPMTPYPQNPNLQNPYVQNPYPLNPYGRNLYQT